MEDPWQFVLYGYRLVAPGVRLSWTDRPYRGYDRAHTLEPGFDFLRDDGSLLWSCQMRSLPDHAYFPSVPPLDDLQRDFASLGRYYEILALRAAASLAMEDSPFQHIRPAEPVDPMRLELLGFDCGWLLGQHSAICQPGFLDQADDVTRESWAKRLNANGLFGEVEDCRDFRDEFISQPQRESGPFDVLEVSLVHPNAG